MHERDWDDYLASFKLSKTWHMFFPIFANEVLISVTIWSSSSSCATAMSDPVLWKKMKKRVPEIVKEVIACDGLPVVMFKNWISVEIFKPIGQWVLSSSDWILHHLFGLGLIFWILHHLFFFGDASSFFFGWNWLVASCCEMKKTSIQSQLISRN